jgi:hypothetical protein
MYCYIRGGPENGLPDELFVHADDHPWDFGQHQSICPSFFHHCSIMFPSFSHHFFHPFVHHFPIIPSNESVNEVCLRISWDGRSNIQVDLVIAMICLLSGSKNDEHLDPPSNYKRVIYP